MDVPGSGEIQDTSTSLDFGGTTEQRSAVFGIPLLSLAYHICRGLPSSGCFSHFLGAGSQKPSQSPPSRWYNLWL